MILKRQRYYQGHNMARLRIREEAEARGIKMLHIARRTGLTLGMVRRYWYSTADGKESGPALANVNMDALQIIADLMKLEPGNLIERSELSAPLDGSGAAE